MFALDSRITNSAGYGTARPLLRRGTRPDLVSAASALYPRETVSDWFNGLVNPFLTVGLRKYGVSSSIQDRLLSGASVTKYVGVDQSMILQASLHVLDTTSTTKEPQSGAQLYDFDDEHYAPFTITSDNITPYFRALSSNTNTVTLSSIRDFDNLHYVFETANNIDRAELSGDINGQPLYEKFVRTRYALFAAVGDEAALCLARYVWNISNWDVIRSSNMDIIHFKDKDGNAKHFTLSGKKPDSLGGGSYSIINVSGGGRGESSGGYFGIAENCTFEDIDIINPIIQRNNYLHDNFKTEDGRIVGFDGWYTGNGFGALAGVAINCTFKNVRVYNDPNNTLKQENFDSNGNLKLKDTGNRILQGIGTYRISGVTVGGIAGVAIGYDGKSTTFQNCLASVILSPEFYYTGGDCLHAGGLVGVAFGEVSIEDSYAACQLGGYYAGGLVGGVGAGPWTLLNNADYWSGVANGSLTIKHSFAAGIIMRQTRVGGGLIASVGKNTPTVEDCYSAVKWEAISPIAYGTFEGDDSNYYIYQTKVAIPVTGNVEAHFTVTGDVLSLAGNNGVPCTLSSLPSLLGDDWTAPTSTLLWQWAERNMSGDLTKVYHFPMPAGNTEFWGNWISDYDSSSKVVPSYSQTSYDGLYVAFHYYSGSEARYIDLGSTMSDRKFYIEDGAMMLTINDRAGFWAQNDKSAAGQTLKQGDVVTNTGSTTVTVEGKKLSFYAPAFYSAVYDPTKGCTAFTELKGDVKIGATILLWDYYWMYCLADFGNGHLTKKYYIQLDASAEVGTANKTGDYVSVNADQFRRITHYTTHTLSPTEGVSITFENGFFDVK